MGEHYLQQKRAIEKQAESYSPVSDIAAFRKFALFTTNLGLALPNLPLSDHLPLFRKAIANRQLCFLDEEHTETVPLEWNKDRKLDVHNLKTHPAIIGTFHVGSYRLINHLLVRQGVPIALLVSNTVKERQGAGFLTKGLAVGDKDACLLITADHPMAGLHILRALKNGRTVVGYLDGNHGAAGQHNLCTFPFLNLDIRVRVGLAHLARRGGVPLHGVITRRHASGLIEICKSRSIYCNTTDSQRISPEKATEMLYADLAEMLKVEPWQWDQWYYLHETFLENRME